MDEDFEARLAEKLERLDTVRAAIKQASDVDALKKAMLAMVEIEADRIRFGQL